MRTVSPSSRDTALETLVFWERFRNEIIAGLIVVLLGVVGFGGYRFYSDRTNAAASALLGSAKNAQDYQQLIARYPNAPAGADAYLLLAEAQRSEKKFPEANATLQVFIVKNPKHELVSTARMAMAANLESMGKSNDALSIYQQIASGDPKSFNAPLALLSQVYLLKAQNRNEEARHICETILTQYRESFWASEAMQQLRFLKPTPPSEPTATPAIPPFLAVPSAMPAGPAAPKTAPTAKPE